MRIATDATAQCCLRPFTECIAGEPNFGFDGGCFTPRCRTLPLILNFHIIIFAPAPPQPTVDAAQNVRRFWIYSGFDGGKRGPKIVRVSVSFYELWTPDFGSNSVGVEGTVQRRHSKCQCSSTWALAWRNTRARGSLRDSLKRELTFHSR
jgi:hypothetical protein